MTQQSPPVVYFPKQSATYRDASHSRIYLSKSNYTGYRPLHRRLEYHAQCPNNTVTESTVVVSLEMKASIKDEDIYALPVTSSDEEDTLRTDKSLHENHNLLTTKRSNEEESIPFPSSKRSKVAVKAPKDSKDINTRSTKEQLGKTTLANVSSGFDDWMISSQTGRSQSSQGKRKANYGKKSFSSTSRKSKTQQAGFIHMSNDDFDADLVTVSSGRKGPKFVTVESPQSSPMKSRTKAKSKMVDVTVDLEPVVKPSNFTVPHDSEDEADFRDGLLQNRRRRRSASSSSSLSEADSVVSLQMTLSQKDDLKNGKDSSSTPALPPNHVRCPVCAEIVDTSIISISSSSSSTTVPEDSLTKLPLQQQQDFCYRHRVHHAQIQWQTKAYPTPINWHRLETQRIPSLIPQLRKILYRKQPSHYLTLLESQITQAKGNKSKIKRYLNEGIIDVVKTGYYGPKGAKIMAHIITEQMAKALKMQQKADRSVTTVGVSGFVSAVLLPEVAVRLVMDDMQVSHEEAREVLDESANVGMLLCPDDDHVDRDDVDSE